MIVPRRYRGVLTAGASSIPTLPSQFRAVSWNLQFCAGRRAPFFYEGGRRVWVRPDDQDRALTGIIEVLRHLDADLVLLQEVDRGSWRTGGVDQLARILDALPGYAAVSTPVHRNRFVPYPFPPLGRLDLHLVTLCRAPLRVPTRIPLPGLAEPAVRAHFNLHRAVLAATIPAAGGALRVANTHLSAFSGGDDTLARQVASCDEFLVAGGPWALLGGDLNLLPPGDNPARLPTDRADHPADRTAIDAFFARHRSVLPPPGQLVPGAGTYIPPGRDTPDRTLDWMFVGGGLPVRKAWVEATDPWLSDHLPVVAELG